MAGLYDACRALRKKFDQFVRQLKVCRECGGVAEFFDNMCDHCGAANPVKIPVSQSVLIVAVGVLMVAVGLLIVAAAIHLAIVVIRVI